MIFSRSDAAGTHRRSGVGGLLVALLSILLLTVPARAHNGDNHGAASASAAAGSPYFTASAVSENFELVLRYEPLRANEPATLRLFVSDFATNEAIHGARLTLTTTGAPTVRLTATETAPGDYRLTGQFPANRPYDLAAQVVTPDGRADLLLLRPVEVGKELPTKTADPDHAADAPAPWLTWPAALLALGGVLLGAGLTALLNRRRRAFSPQDPA